MEGFCVRHRVWTSRCSGCRCTRMVRRSRRDCSRTLWLTTTSPSWLRLRAGTGRRKTTRRLLRERSVGHESWLSSHWWCLSVRLGPGHPPVAGASSRSEDGRLLGLAAANDVSVATERAHQNTGSEHKPPRAAPVAPARPITQRGATVTVTLPPGWFSTVTGVLGPHRDLGGHLWLRSSIRAPSRHCREQSQPAAATTHASLPPDQRPARARP